MNKKIKLIISVGILIIGIVLIILAIFKANNEFSNNKSGNNNKMIFEFSNFIIDNTNDDEIRLSLDIANNTKNKIENNEIHIKFYQKGYVLYTYDYEVNDLDVNSMISISVTLNFEYDNIDKYEILVNDQKKEIKPTIVKGNGN